MTNASPDFARLLAFLESLRLNGYKVGPPQYVSAQNLLLALVDAGELPEDPRELARWLAPIVCSSAQQQAEFYSQFEFWLNAGGKDDEEDRRPESPVGGQTAMAQEQAAESQPPAVGPSILARLRSHGLAVTMVATLLLAAILFSVYSLTRLVLLHTAIPAIAIDVGLPELGNPDNPLPPPTAQESVPLLRPADAAADKPGWGRRLGDLYRQYHVWVRVILASVPLLVFLLWLLSIYVRRRRLGRNPLELQRRLDQIKVKGAGSQLFRDPDFRLSAQDLRRRRELDFADLNIESTVLKTARAGGLFTAAYNLRQVTPEYLALIERTDLLDGQAQLHREIIARLEAENVRLDKFYFDRDPRVCWPEGDAAQSVALAELASRFSEHVVLIFSDGAGFINRFTRKPYGWLNLLAGWQEKILLTPEPVAKWGYRERALSEQGIQVLPSSKAGVSQLAETIRTKAIPPPAGKRPLILYPPSLNQDPERWLSGAYPNPKALDDLRVELQQYLGSEGYYWLCACAAYPLLQWDVTLYLGERLVSPERFEAKLALLVRLPWFRAAVMPDWLRQHLLASLPPQKREEVRAALERLLAGTLLNPEGFEPPAGATPNRLKALLRRWDERVLTRRFIANEPETSPLRDPLFLRFMNGRLPLREDLRPGRWDARWLRNGRLRKWADYTAGPFAAGVLALGIGTLLPRPEPLKPSPNYSASPIRARIGDRFELTINGSPCPESSLQSVTLSPPPGVTIERWTSDDCKLLASVKINDDAQPGDVTFNVLKDSQLFGSFPFQIIDVDCPNVTVTSQTTDRTGAAMVFTAQVIGATTPQPLSYRWTVNGGTIIKGQDSSVITVTSPQDGISRDVTAAVEVSGLRGNCPKTASGTTSVRPAITATLRLSSNKYQLPCSSSNTRIPGVIVTPIIRPKSLSGSLTWKWSTSAGFESGIPQPYVSGEVIWYLIDSSLGKQTITLKLINQNGQEVARGSASVTVIPCQKPPAGSEQQTVGKGNGNGNRPPPDKTPAGKKPHKPSSRQRGSSSAANKNM